MSQQPQSNEPVFPDATSPYPSQPTQPVPSASGPAYPADAAPPAYPPPAAYPPPPAFPPPAAYPPPTQQSGWSQATDRLTGSAPLTPKDERTLGMLAHLVPLIFFVLSAGTLGFIASIVFYIMYKDRGPFVRAHAANLLNVQIITLIGLIISGQIDRDDALQGCFTQQAFFCTKWVFCTTFRTNQHKHYGPSS